ncbi:MAG TPA: hypothetical protein VKY31_15795 [Terriglobia bacterium]|nr:hypothetical protein [Terriglobia bacterium]
MSDRLDCQWIENNLEALFCDRLEPEQDRLARAHIESCESCRREVQAMNAIDPLVKTVFNQNLEEARRPRVAHAGRAIGLSAAALAIVAILLVVVLRTPQTTLPAAPVAPSVAQQPVVPETPQPAQVKSPETTPAADRAKPVDQPVRRRTPDLAFGAKAPASNNAPEFLITDQAGYARKLDDFRGHIVVVALWSGASQEAVSNLERLYQALGSNPKFRFLGISNERLFKPTGTTFPVFYNQGSKLFGIRSGEFALLDENGAVILRGSLTKDFESLQKTVQEK